MKTTPKMEICRRVYRILPKKLLMTPHLDSFSTTDPKPEILSAVQNRSSVCRKGKIFRKIRLNIYHTLSIIYHTSHITNHAIILLRIVIFPRRIPIQLFTYELRNSCSGTVLVSSIILYGIIRFLKQNTAVLWYCSLLFCMVVQGFIQSSFFGSV